MSNSEDYNAMEIAANDPRAVELILEGLQSGPMTSMTADDWNKLRTLVREHVQ
jgi:hypothetical protein